MGKTLWKKFFKQQAIKAKGAAIKNVIKVRAGEKETFRHEEYKARLADHRVEQ